MCINAQESYCIGQLIPHPFIVSLCHIMNIVIFTILDQLQGMLNISQTHNILFALKLLFWFSLFFLHFLLNFPWIKSSKILSEFFWITTAVHSQVGCDPKAAMAWSQCSLLDSIKKMNIFFWILFPIRSFPNLNPQEIRGRVMLNENNTPSDFLFWTCTKIVDKESRHKYIFISSLKHSRLLQDHPSFKHECIGMGLDSKYFRHYHENKEKLNSQTAFFYWRFDVHQTATSTWFHLFIESMSKSCVLCLTGWFIWNQVYSELILFMCEPPMCWLVIILTTVDKILSNSISLHI